MTINFQLIHGDNLDFYMVTIGCQIIHGDSFDIYLMVIHV